MDITKISETEIEVKKPQPDAVEAYDLRALREKKEEIKNRIDYIQAKKEKAQAELAEINLLIEECKKLNIQEKQEVTPVIITMENI